jgi:hypothetical protein
VHDSYSVFMTFYGPNGHWELPHSRADLNAAVSVQSLWYRHKRSDLLSYFSVPYAFLRQSGIISYYIAGVTIWSLTVTRKISVPHSDAN